MNMNGFSSDPTTLLKQYIGIEISPYTDSYSASSVSVASNRLLLLCLCCSVRNAEFFIGKLCRLNDFTGKIDNLPISVANLLFRSAAIIYLDRGQ